MRKTIERSRRFYAMRHSNILQFNSSHDQYAHLSSRKRMKVRVYSLEEAEALMFDMRERGYEGVQNDSYRYCRESAQAALQSGCCYICNTDCSIYVANGHDPNKKKFLDVSKSRFIGELDNLAN